MSVFVVPVAFGETAFTLGSPVSNVTAFLRQNIPSTHGVLFNGCTISLHGRVTEKFYLALDSVTKRGFAFDVLKDPHDGYLVANVGAVLYRNGEIVITDIASGGLGVIDQMQANSSFLVKEPFVLAFHYDNLLAYHHGLKCPYVEAVPYPPKHGG